MEKMVTLLLADDEAEIRAGLRTIVNWENYGIELIGTARNGAEALDMVRYYEPDIVITDIQMPGINGLELVRRAREEQFDCMFVILSGYDDFQYAQAAIKQGVTDYILKPVIVDEFISLIQRLASEVIQKRCLHSHQVKLSRNLNAATKTIRQQNFISELLREELSRAQIDAVLAREHFRLHEGSCAAVVLHIYEQPADTASADSEAADGSITATLKFLERYCEDRPAVFGAINRSAIVIFHNAKAADTLHPDTARMLAELNFACRVNAFGAVGPVVSDLLNIHESFRMATQVASWHIFPEMGCIADASVLSSVGPRHLIKDERIISDIRACDTGALQKDFDAYTNALFFTPYPPPAYLFSMYNFLIMDVRGQLAEAGLKSYTDDAYQAMRQFDTFEEIKNWVLNILMEYISELSVQQAKSQDPLIQKAVEYITANIFNKVGAEDVCHYIGYSKSYFSKYFRQKTNLNFRDYILDLKITYAQQQLKNNTQTPKELSLMLGYEEYSSFSRAFKARTGFSPSDYQKSFY